MNPIFWTSKRHSSLVMVTPSYNVLPAISENWKRPWRIAINTQLRFSASKLTKLVSSRSIPRVEIYGPR